MRKALKMNDSDYKYTYCTENVFGFHIVPNENIKPYYKNSNTLETTLWLLVLFVSFLFLPLLDANYTICNWLTSHNGESALNGVLHEISHLV